MKNHVIYEHCESIKHNRADGELNRLALWQDRGGGAKTFVGRVSLIDTGEIKLHISRKGSGGSSVTASAITYSPRVNDDPVAAAVDFIERVNGAMTDGSREVLANAFDRYRGTRSARAA